MSTNSAVAHAEHVTEHVEHARRDALTLAEVVDPRPDLQEDSLLWARVLKMAWLDHGDHWDTNVFAALHYIRCCGATMDLEDAIAPKKPRYVIKPLLTKKLLDKDGDPIWGDSQWTFEHDYKQDRDDALLPHRDEVMRYLTRLWDEDQEDL